MLRKTLDQQVLQKAYIKKMDKDYNKQMDALIVQKDEEAQKEDEKLWREQRQTAINEKLQRENVIRELIKNRKDQLKKQRLLELEEVNQLKGELERDKLKKQNEIKLKRETAIEVMKQNEIKKMEQARARY